MRIVFYKYRYKHVRIRGIWFIYLRDLALRWKEKLFFFIRTHGGNVRIYRVPYGGRKRREGRARKKWKERDDGGPVQSLIVPVFIFLIVVATEQGGGCFHAWRNLRSSTVADSSAISSSLYHTSFSSSFPFPSPPPSFWSLLAPLTISTIKIALRLRSLVTSKLSTPSFLGFRWWWRRRCVLSRYLLS